MNTTKMRFRIDQAAAIREGKNQYGMTVININPADLTPEQRETLATCWNEYDRDDGLSLPYPQRDFSDLPKIGEATIEAARIILDAHAAAKIRTAKEGAEKKIREAAEKKQRHENNIAEILAKTDEWLADNITGDRPINSPDYYRGFYIHGEGAEVVTDPRLAEKMERAIALRDARNRERAERDRVEREKKEAAEKLEAEKKARQETQIAAWIAEKGSDNQKKRAALNLLPRDEVLNDMRDEAFAPLDGFDRYEKITKSDIACTCDDEDGAPVYKYRAGDETEATAEDFDRMEQIRNLMPGAVVTLRWHQGWCETCYDRAEEDDQDDMVFTRHSIRVAVTVGDFEFTREYAC